MTRELTEADIGKTFKTVNGATATILCRLDGPGVLYVWGVRLSSDGDWDELGVYNCAGECLDDPSESGYDLVFPVERVLLCRKHRGCGLATWAEPQHSVIYPSIPPSTEFAEYAWFQRVTE